MSSPRVPGFRFAGIHCGIKPNGAEPDLALIASDVPAAWAGVFTQSSVVGAPVDWSRECLRSGRGRGVIVNSGISNVAMGRRGRDDAAEMAAVAARTLDCSAAEVCVASTGVIGEPLPMPKLRAGIPRVAEALSADGLADAAEAIRTTDTFAKIAHTQARIGGKRVHVAGIAKGSGMVQPQMATMLAFIVTDAAVAPAFLRRAVRASADVSFNRMSVDGETSTSDTCLLLANGRAGNPPLKTSKTPGAALLRAALDVGAQPRARALARDGEGATKLVNVEVTGALNAGEADAAARRIGNSMLVKTAVFGRDPNWGRILQAVGAGRVKLNLDRTVVKLCGVTVFQRGAGTGSSARKRAEQGLKADEITISIHLGAGRAKAHLWTCDLSYDYVRINAEYTT
jgi:glutamate N-acetyltransferase/amino-acid N-acetyltransferase